MKNRTILDWLDSEESRLKPHFRVTTDRWQNLKLRLGDQLVAQRRDFYDEVAWTFLLGLAYAANGTEGIRSLETRLSGHSTQVGAAHPVWLEALPIPPRKSEGNTNVDLAIGAIGERAGSEGGIEFDPSLGNSITFCEMKWYSDLSKNVTNDQHRNQLSRIIENAVVFQGEGALVDRVTVTLVTPKIFVGTEPKSRLYHYKLEEYCNDPSILLEEWRRSYELMGKRKNQPGWEYPDDSHIESLLRDRLSLRHLSFEELFREAPQSEFSPLMEAFLLDSNGASKRFGGSSFA